MLLLLLLLASCFAFVPSNIIRSKPKRIQPKMMNNKNAPNDAAESSSNKELLLVDSKHSSSTAATFERLKAAVSSTLLFDNDSKKDSGRTAAFEQLQAMVETLDQASLVMREGNNDDDDDDIPINSLLFQVTGSAEPLLVILKSEHRVDVSKLEAHLQDNEEEDRLLSASLVPADQVEELCGFPPQSVPPFSPTMRRLRTIVDAQLLLAVNHHKNVLVGGGGHPSVACRIHNVETLLKLNETEVADISCCGSVVAQQQEEEQSSSSPVYYSKPYFPVAPPALEEEPDQSSVLLLHQQQPITIVGRINGVRRMAKTLVFLDFAPPNHVATGNSKVDSYQLPWLSGVDGKDMAVQLIVGKTFCNERHDDAAAATFLKQLKVGQLILVQGQTNVGNPDSVRHWAEKRSLDIVVHDYQLIREEGENNDSDVTLHMKRDVRPLPKRAVVAPAAPRRRQEPSTSTLNNHLRLSDVFAEPSVKMVDTLEAVHEFAQGLASSAANGGSPVSMVGIDCEWKPNFLMASPAERQPVLLLQISVQKLQTVYLLDLQALLRPCLPPSTPMNEVESATAAALHQLFGSSEFVKVGFQLQADLQRLAGSYPHVEAFRMHCAVVEVSMVATRALQMTKTRYARQITQSLSKLTKFLEKKPMNKEQQVSDWSLRPLSHEQMEYAALDAAVSPILFEKSLNLVNASWLPTGGELAFGRNQQQDASFASSISNIRFLFLDDHHPLAVRKLKAKQIVSDQYIVTQSWTLGGEEPNLPSAPPKEEGPYTDVNGIHRIPAHLMSLKNSPASSELVGTRLGKSKDSCLEALLFADNPLLLSLSPDGQGAKLEFKQRTGYVEFENGVALFVSMPGRPGDPSPRGYPNVWLDEGKSMSWFLRDSEWNQGTSSIAEKLLGAGGKVVSNNNNDEAKQQHAYLFVRMGRGVFLCCGRCRVAQPNSGACMEATSSMEQNSSESWGLVELHLELLDWDLLQVVKDFTSMASSRPPEVTERPSSNTGASELVSLVNQGNLVDAMALALPRVPAGENKSIVQGLEALKEQISAETTPETMVALEKLEEVSSHMFANDKSVEMK